MYLHLCMHSTPHLRHNHETLNLLSLLTTFPLYIHPLFFFPRLAWCFWRTSGSMVTHLFHYSSWAHTIVSPFLRQQQTPLVTHNLTAARMSTGVDNQNHNSKSDYIDSATRHRSISHTDGSAILQSINSSPFSYKQPVNMAQTQRSRYLKTGAIIAFIFMVLVWLSPSQPSASNPANGWCSPCSHYRLQN